MQNQTMTIKVLYGALMFSRLIFAYILYAYIAPGGTQGDDMTLIYVIAGIALITGSMSHFCHMKSYDKDFLMGDSSFFQPQAGGQMIPAESREWSEEQFKTWGLLNKFMTLSILSWSLSETVAVFGLINPFLGGNIEIGMVFIAISFVIGAVHRPNIERLSYNLKIKL